MLNVFENEFRRTCYRTRRTGLSARKILGNGAAARQTRAPARGTKKPQLRGSDDPFAQPHETGLVSPGTWNSVVRTQGTDYCLRQADAIVLKIHSALEQAQFQSAGRFSNLHDSRRRMRVAAHR